MLNNGVKEKVFVRDGRVCLKCGRKKKLTIDHAIPMSRGGNDSYTNLQTLCEKCNAEKGDEIIWYFKKQICKD